MPYRSDDNQQQNSRQVGTGWSIPQPTSTKRIPQQLFDGIPGILVWVALVFSLICTVLFPRVMLWLAAITGIYTAGRFVLSGFANFIGLARIRRWEHNDWQAYYEKKKTGVSLAIEDVQHLIIIPNYKEPIAVLRRSLEALKIQNNAKTHVTIVLAMEAAEPNSHEKGEQLITEYNADFLHIFYTVHPEGLPNEMQCKSANEAWAGRWAKKKLIDELGYTIDHICVTTMDADTRWHPDYLEALSTLFALSEKRHTSFWQAPIRYHGNIWQINPLLRLVNAYSTAIELAYLAAPWWKAMPISSYALSLKLLHESGYWDGDVIADEWHMFIKSYFATGGKVTVEPLMLPFLADATTSEGLWGEIKERYLQTLRHAWGSKEVGYMVAKMLEHPEVSKRHATSLLIRISHDILMAGAGWVILTVGAQLPLLIHPEVAPFLPQDILADPTNATSIIIGGIVGDPIWLVIALAGLIVVILAIVFWYLDVIVRPKRDTKADVNERLWTLVSIPLMPILTLIVLAIPAIQAQTRLMLGQPLNFRVTKKSVK